MQENNKIYLNKNQESINDADFLQLHKAMDKLVYDFICNHNLTNAFSLDYCIDDLVSLRDYGIDCPYCDGYLGILDKDNNPILESL